MSAAKVHVTAEFVQQCAAVNGLALTTARAEALVPMLAALLAADQVIAGLPIHTLPIMGLPWEGLAEITAHPPKSGNRG